MRTGQRGFTLPDLLVSLTLVGLVLSATVKSLSVQTRIHVREEVSAMADQNLRLAMDGIVDTMRAGGDSVPRENLAAWVPWVSGFTANPTIGSGANPEITVARCTPLPAALLHVTAAEGSTHLVLDSAVDGKSIPQLLDTGGRRLVAIGDTVPAVITAVSGTQVDIDVDPLSSGAQGLPRAFVAGAPICRIEVITFRVLEAGDRSVLAANPNDGSGWKSIAEGISNIQVETLEARRRYRITLTAEGEHADPMSGRPLVRSASSLVFLRNADALGG